MSLLLLVLAACGGVWAYFNWPLGLREAVKADLIDPFSARLQHIETGQDGWVCGEVNAKNRMGAYVGWTAFRARNQEGDWSVDVGTVDDPFPLVVTRSCGTGLLLRALEGASDNYNAGISTGLGQ